MTAFLFMCLCEAVGRLCVNVKWHSLAKYLILGCRENSSSLWRASMLVSQRGQSPFVVSHSINSFSSRGRRIAYVRASRMNTYRIVTRR